MMKSEYRIILWLLLLVFIVSESVAQMLHYDRPAAFSADPLAQLATHPQDHLVA